MTLVPARLRRFVTNLPIPYKFAVIIIVFILAIGINFTLSYLGLEYISACRAYVGGEGLWSKAQKQAVLSLGQYGISHQRKYYEDYLTSLSIPLGDMQARLELEKQKPDYNVVTNGFLRGGNHPKDIPLMIDLFRQFRRVYYMDRAIDFWRQADACIVELQSVGQRIHDEIRSARPSERRLQVLLARVYEINYQVTPLENAFSSTLGQGARWIGQVTLSVKIVVSTIMLLIALLFAVSIARQLCNEIDLLRTGARRIARGDFDVTLDTNSEDEIGELATTFREMAVQRKRAEESLVEQRKSLASANHELEAFSYSVSHDLRAPLRAIDGFSKELLQSSHARLDHQGQADLERICAATQRMSQLIDDLLALSRLSQTELQTEEVNLSALCQEIKRDLEKTDPQRKVEWKIHASLKARSDSRLMRVALENLLQNAWKFTRRQTHPKISFDAKEVDGNRIFSIHDNGVGFDMAYIEKLFRPFQRLHDSKEFPGTGIGLALVQRIIRRHGGQVWAESQENYGAAFHFTIP